MRSSLSAVFVVALALSGSLSAQNFDLGFQTTFPTPLSLPPSGSGGTCGDPAATRTVSLFQPINSCVAEARIFINLTHTRAGDLRIRLEHCGVSVQLYDRSLVGGCDLNGQYFFDDNAPTTFAAAIAATPSAGVLAPGSYRPSEPLSAFDGLSAYGNWNLVICDEVNNGQVGALNSGAIDITYTTTSHNDPGLPVNVPLGGNGFNVCQVGFSSTQVRTINFAESGPVGYVMVDLGINHPDSGDLIITLEHNNIVRTVFNGCGNIANFAGTYSISDFFPSLCTAANAGNVNPSGTNIPTGNYAPAESFSAFNNTDMNGPWKLTVCDRGAAIGSVGQLTYFNIRVVRQCGLTLSLTQPNGNASIVVTTRHGFPGNLNYNFFTGSLGSYPNGWLYGIDISLADLLSELSIPAPSPFSGFLDACGERSYTLVSPIPPGLTFYGVAVEVTPQGVVIGNSAPISYTTL